MAAKKGKQRRGRPKKSTTIESEAGNIDNEDEITCSKCSTVFADEGDKLLECERCEQWYCIECVDMIPSVYSVMVANKNLHWFCVECEKPALSAVRSDKDIEERCAAYMSTLSCRMDGMEENLNKKADKTDVEDLEKRVKRMESVGRGTEPASSSEAKKDTVSETINEQREREFRVKNLIIQNLKESNESEFEKRQKEDVESVKKLLSTIGVVDEVIESCQRLGAMDPDKVRITKIAVDSVQTRKTILNKAKTLKNHKEYGSVYIGPDLTKLQREERFKLRKELRDRKEKGETDIFIRGRRIVQGKDKALRFRGGAASAGEAATEEETR